MPKLVLALLVLLFALPVPQAMAKERFVPIDKDMISVDYPFPVSFYEFRAQEQNLRMAYMDVAPKTEKPNGKVVVLLHGKNFSASYWEKTIEELTAEGYRVIAPDQIGFGKSTKPDRIQYSFHSLGLWTDDLVRSLKIKDYELVGHSMGGMLATRMALMFPDRIKRLALIDPLGLEDWRKTVPYRTVDDWYKRELEMTPDKIRAYQVQSYYGGKWKPEYEDSIANQGGWTLHKDYPVVAWNSALIYDMILTQPVVYEFPNLKMPTLLIVGTRDRTALGADSVKDRKAREKLGRYDRLGKKTAATNPKIQLVEIKGVGHLPQVEAYDKYIAALTTFLGK